MKRALFSTTLVIIVAVIAAVVAIVVVIVIALVVVPENLHISTKRNGRKNIKIKKESTKKLANNK